MSSIFNYDILSNFRYTDIFFYHNIDQRITLNDGLIDNESSDIVSSILKLGEKPYKGDSKSGHKCSGTLHFHTNIKELHRLNVLGNDSDDGVDGLLKNVKKAVTLIDEKKEATI